MKPELNGTLDGKGARKGNYTEETRRKIGDASRGNTYKRGKKISAETKQRISDATKGKPKSEEHIRKVCEALKIAMKRPEVRQKISEALKCGNNPSKRPEVGKKISEALKALPRQLCPYCHREFSPSNYAYWHGDRCKHNPDNHSRLLIE